MYENEEMNRFLEMAVETPEDLLDLIPGFIKRRKEEFLILEEHMLNENYIEIKRIGHKLKGHGVSYGFAAISEMGKSLEFSAEKKEKQEIQSYLNHYKEFLNQV